MDHVCDLANEMFFTRDLTKLLKEVYSDVVVDDVEIPYIVNLLSEMTLERAKIVISAKDLLKKQFIAEHHHEGDHHL